MEAVIARGIQALIALAGAYLVALWFVLVVWTYRDIETRSKNVLTQVFSTLLVVLFYIPGVLLYMILRPKETLDSVYQRSLEEEYLLQDLEELPLCIGCQRYVEDDFILCPHCHTTLREPCVQCARLVHLKWALCPYCGTEQSQKVAALQERVAAPAARWRSALPSVPRRRTVAAVNPRSAPVQDERPQPRREPAAASVVERETVMAVREVNLSPTLTVVRTEASEQSPVRLFDRRKTRAAANRSGSEQAVNGSANGYHDDRQQNGHGHGSLSQVSQHAPYLFESQNGNGVQAATGEHVRANDNPMPKRSRKRDKVGAGIVVDGD